MDGLRAAVARACPLHEKEIALYFYSRRKKREVRRKWKQLMSTHADRV